MDIFLNDKSSLQFIRSAYRRDDVSLIPANARWPQQLELPTVKFSRLKMPETLALLKVPEQRSLGLLVPSKASRVRSQGIECSVCSRPRGDVPFLQLVSSNPTNASRLVPKHGRVFLLSPGNIILGMAHRLRHLQSAGSLTHKQALLLIVKLILELCGTFSHDPLSPNCGPVAYKTQPLTNVSQLQELFEQSGHEHGLALAREAAKLSYDLSGSPQESFLGPALFFDGRFGGLDLCSFVANKPLDLSHDEHRAIAWRIITPDFQLVGYRSVVEYLGEVHSEGDNPDIDHVRSLDYQTLGWREFAFWYKDVCNRQAFMTSAARLVSVLEQYDGAAQRIRFAKKASDPRFCSQQQTLFEVFRPWLR